MRTVSLAVLVLVSGVATAAPLRHDAMTQVMNRVDKAVRVVLKVEGAALNRTGQARPATRAEMVAEFDRIMTMARPRFRGRPIRQVVDQPLIDSRNPSPETRAQLKRLIEWGFVGPVSPLATDPTQTLTPQQFGDALGYFMSRLADVTHTYDPRFSPANLSNDD
ncbi:MAG TPA: hypothetical protein PLB31_02340 [Fimbriimonadaceae bacterium]|nr:hypothetical protein [Armatimonadota bacterium]HCM73732.1 hypothetical protein [Armatimonadota bacterium]HRD31449.1 hypothetical protein [Fimbriimonadaceae bacterium]HRE93591.1 hypothetical protein [Fimbriimonadaceae bacterium]HRI73288.1 hypothetical protein [Fimbriimonadaceae bacterium]